MGAAEEPPEGGVSSSRQVQVLWNRTESPGSNVEALTLLTVSHGVDGAVPLFESLPTATQLSM